MTTRISSTFHEALMLAGAPDDLQDPFSVVPDGVQLAPSQINKYLKRLESLVRRQQEWLLLNRNAEHVMDWVTLSNISRKCSQTRTINTAPVTCSINRGGAIIWDWYGTRVSRKHVVGMLTKIAKIAGIRTLREAVSSQTDLDARDRLTAIKVLKSAGVNLETIV